MMRPLAVAAFVAAFSAAAPVRAQELLQDTKLGIKLRAPKDFSKVPLKPDEEWIVARWTSEKSYNQVDKKDGSSIDHKPELNVIAFPSDKVKEKVTEEKTGTGKESTTILHIKNPFKDYRDYLKRTYNDGGFYISSEDKAEVEGIPVETLEVKIERMVFGGPRKIITWIFKCDDGDYAVQFEIVESAWPKLKGDILACMRSFRRLPKDGDAAAQPNKGPTIPLDDVKDLTPAQRAARRREQEAATFDKFTKDLPQGWTAKKYDRVVVLSHVDDKYTQKIAADANAVLDYLDANFGYVGPGEYVRSPIVRICKDYDEERVYHKGSSWSFDREITTCKDTGGMSSFGNEVTRDCCEHWFSERDRDIWFATPQWLRIGLESAFGKARAKNGKLEFFNDSSERVGVNAQVRTGKLSKIQDLVKMDPEELWKDHNKDDECAAVTRFLVTGPKKAKETLKSYIGAVATIARRDEEESKKKVKGSVDGAPKTVEEEDAKFKEERTKMREGEKKHLDEVYQAAFGAFTDADWKSLQSAYEKSLG